MNDDSQFENTDGNNAGTSQETDAASGRPAPETNPDEVRDAPQTSSNQRRTEPVPPSPGSPPPDFVPGGQHRDPDAANATTTGLGGAETGTQGDVGTAGETGRADVPAPPAVVAEPPVPSPGNLSDEHGHIAVSTKAAQGTSEELPSVEGIKTTALAQRGKPDGEVAT